MKISLLIPCYNAAPFLAETVASAWAQTRPPDEIIIVDDGSTDASAEVAASLTPPVKLIRQHNRGVGAALNTALAAASGELIAFLDSDDLWVREKLEWQLAALAADPALDGVFGHMQLFGDTPPAPPVPGLVKGTLLVRRAVYDRYGLFDPGNRLAEFIDWHGRAIEQGFRWQMLPQTVYLRRVHKASVSQTGRPAQYADYLSTIKAFLDRRRAL
jgi:glycosyltransferase involved in cell wall biosynthesis